MAEDQEQGSPKDKGAGKKAGGGSTAPELLKSAMGTAVPLIVSAVVSVGFVAFAGKAILWARFTAIQVPGEQVVKAVPQGEAVATGASLLLIFGVLGVLAVLIVYMIDSSGRATADMSRGVLAVVAAEGLVAVWLTAGKSLPDRVVASEVVLLTVGGVLWATYVAKLARGKEFAGLRKGEFKRKPNGAFYRTGNCTHCTGDGPCCDEPTSGFTGKELGIVLVAALAVAIVGFVVALLVHPIRDWRWVVAVELFGCVLAGVIVVFGYRFRKDERDATTKEKSTAAATKKKADEKGAKARSGGQGDPARPAAEDPGDARAAEAWARAERQAGRLGALLARLISQFRAGVGSSEPSPTILVVAEAAVEPPAEDAGDRKGDGVDDSPDRQTGVDLTGWGVLFVLACSAVLIVIPWWALNEWWLGVFLIVAVLVGAGLWRIAGMSREGFAWFGLAVFISVPLCGTVMMMTRNLDEPKVQPLALIRTTDGPDEAIEGLFVTETSDRVYFANVATEGCSNDVTPNSGRLLWVPSKEVISTEIGPLQSVEDAGRSALEMSHDLTPGVETSGATFDLTPAAAQPAPAGGESPASGGTEAGGASGAAGPTVPTVPAGGTATDARLQNLGPAVRPNFGAGLRIEPETVSPDEEATLRLSKENEHGDVNGFGESREGRNLWLGGRRLDISKEPAGKAAGAEYIELGNERLVKLEKEAVYVKASDGSFVPKEDADEGEIKDPGPFVLIEDPAVTAPEEGSDGLHVKVRKEAGRWIVDETKTLTLAGGKFEGQTREEEKKKIQGKPLVRQAWHSDHIRFHVPADARSGVVSVGCGQLSGAPLLQVRHKPDARIAVRVPSHRSVLTFSGRPSTAGPPAHALPPADDGRPAPNLIPSWWVDGVRQGHGEVVHLRLTPRWKPYRVELKVADREGNFDTAKLRILRLPAAGLRYLRKPWWKRHNSAPPRVRRQIQTIVDHVKPAAVELDGYANGAGGVGRDVGHSLRVDELVRRYFLRDRASGKDKGENVTQEEVAAKKRRPIPIEEMGHGDTCPLPRHPAAIRAHVDLFLLDQGAVVKPVPHCHALMRRQILWRPPTAAERGAEAKGREEAKTRKELSKVRRELKEARE